MKTSAEYTRKSRARHAERDAREKRLRDELRKLPRGHGSDLLRVAEALADVVRWNERGSRTLARLAALLRRM
jgi:hypothetical protein